MKNECIPHWSILEEDSWKPFQSQNHNLHNNKFSIHICNDIKKIHKGKRLLRATRWAPLEFTPNLSDKKLLRKALLPVTSTSLTYPYPPNTPSTEASTPYTAAGYVNQLGTGFIRWRRRRLTCQYPTPLLYQSLFFWDSQVCLEATYHDRWNPKKKCFCELFGWDYISISLKSSTSKKILI